MTFCDLVEFWNSPAIGLTQGEVTLSISEGDVCYNLTHHQSQDQICKQTNKCIFKSDKLSQNDLLASSSQFVQV